MLKAAIIVNGETFTAHTHSDAIFMVPTNGKYNIGKRNEGFVTEDGTFLTRREAFEYATKNDLLNTKYLGPDLFSWMLK